MSCTDPILSIEALIQRAALYSSSACGALKYAEESAESDFACPSADIPDLVLLAMAFDSGANTFRVAITNVAIGDLCDDYELKIECDGVTPSQAIRSTFTVGDDVAVIRVLFVTGATGSCASDCVGLDIEGLVGATVVTDGTDSYVLAIAPEEVTEELDCTTSDIGAETYARSAISPVGSCGMRAWRISEATLGADFNSDFSNDFNI